MWSKYTRLRIRIAAVGLPPVLHQRGTHCLTGHPAQLAYIDFMLLEVDPEELRSADEIRDPDPHLIQFVKRELFGASPFPVHPVKRYTGTGFYAVKDFFHDIS